MKKILKLIALLLIAVLFLRFGSIDTDVQDEVVEIQPIPGPLGNTLEQNLNKNQENIDVSEQNLNKNQENNIGVSEQNLNKKQENNIDVSEENLNKKQENNIDVSEENLNKKQENNIDVSEENLNKKQESNIDVSEENLNKKQESGIVSDKNAFVNQENKAESEQNESKKQEIETKPEENLTVNQEKKAESEQEGEAYSSIQNNIFGITSYYENNVLTPLKGAKILIYGKGDNGLETIGEATSDITGKYNIVSTSGEALFYENFEVHINDSSVENMLLLNLEEDGIVENNVKTLTVLDIANGVNLNFVMQPTFTGTVKSHDKNGSNISNATINLKTPYEMLVTQTDLNGVFSQQVKMQKIESQIIDVSVSEIDHNDYFLNGKIYNITIDMLKQNKPIDMGIFVLESNRLEQLADKVYTLYYIKKTNNSLTLEWNKVSGATGYEIEFNNQRINTTRNSYVINGLKSNVAYTFRVRALYEKDLGLFSNRFVMKINIFSPQTEFSKLFLQKCEEQDWFIDEIENILNSQGKSINSIESTDLSGIYALGLSNRNTKGKIPAAIGELKNLKYLYLANNNLEGNLPSELFQLHNLVNIDLSYNRFTGSLEGLDNLSNLKVLMLNNNNFEGNIKEIISKLGNLVTLNLSANNFQEIVIQ